MEGPNSITAAVDIVVAYNSLVERALKVVAGAPFHAVVENEESAHLTIHGEEAVLRWSYFESDYYGGGHLSEETTTFPTCLLFLSDAELEAFKKRAKQEEVEKAAKVRAAQEAVARERAEARDRMEFARLCAKYGQRG